MRAVACPRCGASIPADRLVCPKCSPDLSEVPRSPLGDAEPADSTSFLYQNDPSVAVSLVTPRTKEQTRLLTWLAIGLLIASFTTGVLYTLFYLRVGNTVSELLPRDTLAYVVMRRPGEVREAFQNLNLWTNTRPVRSAIRQTESEFVSEFLLDLGVNRHLFGIIQDGVSRVHMAVLPSASDEAPFEILVFGEFEDAGMHTSVKERLDPFFEDGGRESGRSFQIRRLSSTTVTLVHLQKLMVLGIGTGQGIRTVLANLESSPARSLHDVQSFRNAWRARAAGSNIFAFSSDLAAWTFAATREKTGWDLVAEQLAKLASQPEKSTGQGVSFDLSIRGGSEASNVSLHVEEGQLDDLRDTLGQNTGVLLTAVPVTSEFTLTVSVTDADGLFDAVRSPLIEGLSRLGLVDFGPPPYPWLNQLQAESGVYFTGDLLSHVNREVGFALVPDNDQLAWLFLADLRVPQRALARVAKIITEYHRATTSTARADAILNEDGLYKTARITADGDTETTLCWSLESSTFMMSESCAVVGAARSALLGDQGIKDLPSVRTLLSNVTTEAAATAVVRPHPIMKRLGIAGFDDIPFAPDHVVVGGVRLDDEHIELTGNVPVLSALYFASVSTEIPLPGDDAAACSDFIEAVCTGVSPKQCDSFRAKVANSAATACRTGLRTYRALQTSGLRRLAPLALDPVMPPQR